MGIFRSRAGCGAMVAACLWLGASSVDADQKPLPTLDELVRGHVAAWSKLQEIEVEFDSESRWTHLGVVTSDRSQRGQLWRRSKEFERLRTSDGREVEDRLIGNGEARRLSYAVPTVPLVDSDPVSGQGRIQGTIQRGDRTSFRLHASTPNKLERVTLPPGDELGSLAEFFARWPGRVVEEITENGDRKVVVEAASRESAGGEWDAGRATLVFNLSKGGLLDNRELVQYFPDGDGKPVPVRFRFAALAWCEPEPGIWFPTKVEAEMVVLKQVAVLPDPGSIRSTWTATRVRLLQDVPSGDRLGFRFPEKTAVRDSTDPARPQRVVEWGPDDRPLRELSSGTESELDGVPDLLAVGAVWVFQNAHEMAQEVHRGRVDFWRYSVVSTSVAVADFVVGEYGLRP